MSDFPDLVIIFIQNFILPVKNYSLKVSFMKNSKVLKTVLFLLGLMLIVLGTWRLTMPVEFL